MHFVHLIIDGAPAKFSHEPCKDDDELIDTIASSYLGSSGQNVAARLRLLKIFLGSKCIVTECDWGAPLWADSIKPDVLLSFFSFLPLAGGGATVRQGRELGLLFWDGIFKCGCFSCFPCVGLLQNSQFPPTQTLFYSCP